MKSFSILKVIIKLLILYKFLWISTFPESLSLSLIKYALENVAFDGFINLTNVETDKKKKLISSTRLFWLYYFTKFGTATHLITNCNHNLLLSLNLQASGATFFFFFFLIEKRPGLDLADYLPLADNTTLYDHCILKKRMQMHIIQIHLHMFLCLSIFSSMWLLLRWFEYGTTKLKFNTRCYFISLSFTMCTVPWLRRCSARVQLGQGKSMVASA